MVGLEASCEAAGAASSGGESRRRGADIELAAADGDEDVLDIVCGSELAGGPRVRNQAQPPGWLTSPRRLVFSSFPEVVHGVWVAPHAVHEVSHLGHGLWGCVRNPDAFPARACLGGHDLPLYKLLDKY